MNLAEAKHAHLSGTLEKQGYISEMHRLHSRLFEYPEFLPGTDITRIEITGEGVVMTFKQAGIRMVCDPQDKRIAPIETLNFGHYEGRELELVLKMVRPGATVFDIGANVGWYSLNIARNVAGVRVVAFEPLPNTFKLLCTNIRLNDVANVEPQNVGLADKPGELVFYFCKDSSGSASAANIGERADAQQFTCPVTTLDEFAGSRGLQADFIKCDVEGAELLVFRGARKCLETHQPVVMSEMLRKWCRKFNYHPNDIIDLFHGLGYGCFIASGEGLSLFESMDESTTDTNFFFLHLTKHADLIRELVAAGA